MSTSMGVTEQISFLEKRFVKIEISLSTWVAHVPTIVEDTMQSLKQPHSRILLEEIEGEGIS